MDLKYLNFITQKEGKKMKKRIYVAMCAAGIALMTGCMSREEIKAAQEKAKAERFAAVKKRADAGDGRMAYQAGIMLINGRGVKRDSTQAFVYFEKAIKAGNTTVCWSVMNLICKTRDTEHSKLFGDCFQLLWNKVWIRYAWPTKESMRWNRDKRHEEFYKKGLTLCLNYLNLLQKAEKDAATYELKKRLLAIVEKRPSDVSSDSRISYDGISFIEKLTYNIKTKAEIIERERIAEEKRNAEQKRLAEQKRIAEPKFRELDQNEQKKFPNRKLGKGIRLYKDIYAGSSLEWLQSKAAVSSQEISKGTIRPMFLDEFLLGIPENWQGQAFRQTYTIYGKDRNVTYIFAGMNNNQTMIGCYISLRNVSPKSIIEKYKKEFPGLKIQEKIIDDTRCVFMLNPKVRIQVVLLSTVKFVSILIADQKYVDLYRNIIQESARNSDQKALDF